MAVLCGCGWWFYPAQVLQNNWLESTWQRASTIDRCTDLHHRLYSIMEWSVRAVAHVTCKPPQLLCTLTHIHYCSNFNITNAIPPDTMRSILMIAIAPHDPPSIWIWAFAVSLILDNCICIFFKASWWLNDVFEDKRPLNPPQPLLLQELFPRLFVAFCVIIIVMLSAS